MNDVTPPARPTDETDRLIAYLSGPFPERKARIDDWVRQTKRLRHKEDVVRLGYEIVEFWGELDNWIGLAEQVYDQTFADQFDAVHEDRAKEANEDLGSKRPNAKLVESQAKKNSAVFKRALNLLKAERHRLERTLFWCGQQQRLIAAEEYGDLMTSRHDVPDAMIEDAIGAEAPSVADALTGVLESR